MAPRNKGVIIITTCPFPHQSFSPRGKKKKEGNEEKEEKVIEEVEEENEEREEEEELVS